MQADFFTTQTETRVRPARLFLPVSCASSALGPSGAATVFAAHVFRERFLKWDVAVQRCEVQSGEVLGDSLRVAVVSRPQS